MAIFFSKKWRIKLVINRQNIKKDDMAHDSWTQTTVDVAIFFWFFLIYSTIHNSCFLCFDLTNHKAYFSRHFHFIQNHFPSFWLPSMSVTKSMISKCATISRSLTSLHSQNSFQHVSQNLPPPAPSYSPPTSSHDFRDITPTSSTESNPSLKGDRCPYYQFIIIWIYDISQKYMYSDRTC